MEFKFHRLKLNLKLHVPYVYLPNESLHSHRRSHCLHFCKDFGIINNYSYAILRVISVYHIVITRECNILCNTLGNPHLPGLYSLRRRRLISIGILIINLRRSSDGLRLIMGIPIPVRRRLLSWREAQVSKFFPNTIAVANVYRSSSCGYSIYVLICLFHPSSFYYFFSPFSERIFKGLNFDQ